MAIDPNTGVETVGTGESERWMQWLLGPGGDAVRQFNVAANATKAQTNDHDFRNTLQGAERRDLGLAGQQQQHIGMLQANAEGRGVPSLAQMQLQRALMQNQANAAGQVAAQRGLNPALAARLVGQNSAMMAQEAAGQGAMLRAQEQLAAQQLLGQTLQGVRGQEQGLFGTSANANQGQNALGVQNHQQTQALNAQIAENNRQAAERAEQRRLGLDQARSQATRDVTTGLLKTAAQGATGFATGGASGAAGAIAAFDGAVVPGVATVPGDSPRNDTVDAKVSPNEIILPRTVTTAPDAPERAAAFVAGIKKGVEAARPAPGLVPTTLGASDTGTQRLVADTAGIDVNALSEAQKQALVAALLKAKAGR